MGPVIAFSCRSGGGPWSWSCWTVRERILPELGDGGAERNEAHVFDGRVGIQDGSYRDECGVPIGVSEAARGYGRESDRPGSDLVGAGKRGSVGGR